ncbi:MAG: AMP-dependent synthetase and ligase [Pseudonocardiales bacterium]|nr:AMP-dependent synthetase and ligase [Pseudonocardiales bacterium]
MAISLLLDIAQSLDSDRLAVGRRAEQITAGRLSELAAAGASVLIASGAKTLVFVGINSPAFPVALFAAAGAGIPVAPLNYRLSGPQLEGLVGRLAEPLIVADDAYAPLLADLGLPMMTTDEWMAKCAELAEGEIAFPEDSDPAVLLFTSGTTAEPKCVILRHENLQSYVLGTIEPGSSGADEAALVSVPPYHIAGVGTVLTNIFSGRRLLYLPNFTADDWLSLVREEEVTFTMVVPTMLARIVDAIGDNPANLPHLRTIAYGGARMPQPVLERALALLPHVDFVNAYGLTETSSTIAVLGPDDHKAALTSDDPAVRSRLGSTGRLIPGVEGQIRDSEGKVLGPGEVGELWVRGEQVSGEYAGIGSVLDSEGWFPTKDRAWLDDENYLFIGGRTDDVIIRGGENISPAEIEDVLLRHDGVAEAAVIGVPDEEWGERIAAIVVVAVGAEPDPEELRAWVRERLRSSKTPDRIFFRDELPHTDTGKLLRRVLVSEFSTSE